jgi:pimeloyl-[acyl-carrier protein] methyl ester esterase
VKNIDIFKSSAGKGKELVILHGCGCDHQHMQPVADHLSHRYHVSSFDLPGRGKSAWDSRIETIHDIADQLLPHLPAQATYVGWSFGGLITMSIASRFPERVNRIVGITTTPKFIEAENWPGFPQPGFGAFFKEINNIGVKQFLTQYYDNEFSHCQEKPKTYHDLLEILNHDVSDVDILLKGIHICDQTDLRNEFSAIQCPIDLILGSKDDSVNIESISNIKALNPRVSISVIPEAKHMPFWTHQEAFNKMLDSVL